MKIKNCPDYLFNDNMIVNIKDFDSILLKIYKFFISRGFFCFDIYFIKYIPTKIVDHIDDDKDYLYLLVDDVDGYIKENDGVKYLVFNPTEKSKEALKNYTKL